jgi:MFS family permease
MTEAVTSQGLEDSGESKGLRSVLTHRDFSLLWSGQLVSNIGTAIATLALMFYAFDLTQSPMAMAILAIAQTIPVVAFAGPIGVYIDRWNRKTIMVASDITRATVIILPRNLLGVPPHFCLCHR